VRLTVLKNHVPIDEVLVETPDLNERYEIYVGRSEDCHVLIDDPLISRHHLVLKNENGKWYCEKLSQLGVVSINGIATGKMEVNDGDEIKCGAYSLMVLGLPQMLNAYAAQPNFQSEPALFYQEAKPVPQVAVSAAANMAALDEMGDDLAPIGELDSTSMMNSETAEAVESDSLSMDDLESSDEFSNNEENSFQDDAAAEETITSNDFGGSDDSAGFGGDEAEVEDDSDEKTSFFKAFVNYQLVLFGEHAPYDRYQIDSPEIFIGRDPKKCQIVLDDPEVSTVHAVIRKNNIEIILEDLNSSNGTILNAERINRATLATGDEFVIGSTSFSLETRSDLLDAENDRLMPVEKNQSIDLEEIEEELVDVGEDGVDFGDAPVDKSFKGRWKNDKKFKRNIIIGILVCLGLWLMPGEEEAIKPAETVAKTEAVDKNAPPALVLSKELEAKRNMSYELGVSFFDQNKYDEALKEFETVESIDKDYKRVQTYLESTKTALRRIADLEAQKRAEEDRLKTKKLIEELLVKAREAVKDKNITVAESLFAQIAEKDPENMEVQQLKMELEAWQKEQERIALEKATKEASRKAMVDALNPGKTYYLKKEWYRAILKLEEFLRRKGTDEDLIKEGSDMLADAKNQLASELGPLVGKARSLKEGQDLKSAYEAYLDILKVEPTHPEALNEVDEIRSQLESRSKKIYREAIIAESLSLFNDAKEKFTEVQQISPSDSEYYRKASEKLKNYLE
jgi:pSer/pThr/pTyr-binding forkhead associated (FHA) protein